MAGVLNETTRTVHELRAEEPRLRTECGVANHLEGEQLRKVSVDRATRELDASKCGRCFDDAGGY
jgi:hypothetical protein